ncbi:MAG TPA: M48 family metallopeptidase [Vitreimonas sp.]|uniref:M48 family metallopeptidase n=1 Tax=Vitreimonas sp. TaxID=3069702 RepID=UPI002D688882|nr:M48 family metallopeptidase [Vitreimonas sp.]HYD89605.1 M48 family metallopeptidase [Vitreimonas sp.]
MRSIGLAAFAAATAFAAPAAAASLPFDPELATHAWLATLGPEATARSNAYFEGGYIIDFVSTAISIAVAALILLLGWARGVRSWLEKTVKWFPLVALGVGFFVNLVSTVITFPFTYYVGFVRQHRYDLSTQTFPEWFGEQMIGVGIGLVIGSIFIAIIYMIIRAARNTWWIWGSAVTIAFAAVMSMLFPIYIAPLFNESVPMEQSELRDDIIAMAQANGVPADNVYVYDRSRQTNSISANVSGFGPTTRISLADTLLERASPEATRAVMAHEIGHYVLGHMYSGLIMSAMLILFSFAFVHFTFRAFAKNERWGIRDISDPAGLPLILVLLSVVGLITAPLQRNLIYFNEQQADMFGLNAAREPDGFAEAAVLLSEYRKMQPSQLEEWFFYDHPSGWNRVHNAMVWKAHEIAAGRLPPSPGGPPEGWVPDFVRDRQAQSETPDATPASEAADASVQ